MRSIRARFALFRCAPYGLYAGYVLGLAPLRAYAVGYGHSALFRLRSIRAPYASAIVRRYAASRQSTEDIYVLRGGQKLHCNDVYQMTEADLGIRDGTVHDEQKGRKRQ